MLALMAAKLYSVNVSYDVEIARKYDVYSRPQLQTTTQKNIVKMEIDESRESRRIRKWKEGFGEETETSRGWLSHRFFKPLGVSINA